MDTFGRLGEDAIAILKTISRSACLNSPHQIVENPQVWQGKYRRELVMQLSITLTHTNYCIVEESALKSLRSYISTAAMYRGLKKRGW